MLVPPTGLTKDAGRDVLLPLEKAAQLTPSSASLSTSTSTMIASTSTCGRRMSSLSMMSMTARMIFGGAVMTSALLVGSAQTMALFSACCCGEPPPRPPAPRRTGGGLGDAGDLLLELRGDLLGIRVVQVAHPRVAAGLERRVEVRDQRAHAQPLRLIAADQHAVGALVGHHLHGRRPRRQRPPW